MTNFTETQLQALSTAVAVAPNGFALEPDREEDRGTCDSLVASGHLVSVEVEEAYGYRVSDEFLKAVVHNTANRAKQANLN